MLAEIKSQMSNFPAYAQYLSNNKNLGASPQLECWNIGIMGFGKMGQWVNLSSFTLFRTSSQGEGLLRYLLIGKSKMSKFL